MVLIHLFSVKDSFSWLRMGTLQKNIQLIMDFLRAPFLFLHFFNYKLMTFPMMLSVILMSILIILLSTLSMKGTWFVAATGKLF